MSILLLYFLLHLSITIWFDSQVIREFLQLNYLDEGDTAASQETAKPNNDSGAEVVEIKKESPEVIELDNDEPPKKANQKLDGLTVVIRSNRQKELMLHVTAKNIGPELKEQLKKLFETGKGKECNVKCMHCKNIVK